MTAKELRAEALSLQEIGEIKKIVKNLYKTYYSSDRTTLFSYLDTEFQRQIPLNYFLTHGEFNAELGKLVEIGEITLLDDGQAAVVCKIKHAKGIAEINLSLRKDYGGWKVKGNSLFRRKVW